MTPSFKNRPHRTGERQKSEFRVNFSSQIKVMFQGTQLSSNGGLLLYRDLDHALKLTNRLSMKLSDHRVGKNISHSLPSLLYQSIYSRLAGYEDINDAEILKQDPIIRHCVGKKAVDKQAAASSEMQTFETQCLTQKENFKNLNDALGDGIMTAHSKRKPLSCIIFDMDSSVSPSYGQQEGVEYNGYFKSTCYHPLFCFNQFGDCEGMLLRKGASHSAADWEQVLVPIIERYRHHSLKKYFRGDAAFGEPGLYVTLEQEGFNYAMRLKENARLMNAIHPLLTRPVGRPSNTPKMFYHRFRYQGTKLGSVSLCGG